MFFATGLIQPEGPILLPNGSWLVTEMGAVRGCITYITSQGSVDRVIAHTGRPNGLALDHNGVIWTAESKTPSLLKVQMTGAVEVFLTHCGDEPLLFPNDLAFGPDGMLYMTDSGILIDEFAPGGKAHPNFRNLQPDGRVYQVNPETREIRRIDHGLRFPNGIAFGPDSSLYVNETLTGNVYRYRWTGSGVNSSRELFGNVFDPLEADFIGGPDGMKFGRDGRLFVAVYGRGDITILNPDGSLNRRLATQGSLPTNLAFGPVGSLALYVTEESLSDVEMIPIDTDGLPLYRGEVEPVKNTKGDQART
jgi:gluconolactonase